MCEFIVLFFFFKQKTAYEMRISDWSSDVCSSDLIRRGRSVLCSGAVKRGARTRGCSPPTGDIIMKIVVIGGSGLIGSKLVARLTAQGREEIGRASCRERVCQYG